MLSAASTLGSVAASARDIFTYHLHAAVSITQQSKTGKTRRSRAGIFAHWESFCQDLGHDALLSNVAPADRLSFLLAYGHKYRQLGKWSPRKTPKPVRAGTVDAALIAIGQGFTDLGRQDPRKAPGSDTLLPVYRDFIEGLRRNDGPQTRVYPVGLTFIKAMHEWLDFEDKHHGLFNHHVLQLTIIGFFWLIALVSFSTPTTLSSGPKPLNSKTSP